MPESEKQERNSLAPMAPSEGEITHYDKGHDSIRAALRTMPKRPGVYRMLDKKGKPLYVGKAKNLESRIKSYLNTGSKNARTIKMISETHSVEVIRTHTEAEALLLESNLIKRLKPRFNILLRDDKSFPHIVLTEDKDWPQLSKHRGMKTQKGRYFGPFASAHSVNRTLNILQKAFPLRSCSDSIFSSRTRPCLQYQIRRCTAPCVDKITPDSYEKIVSEARLFLNGRSQTVQKQLSNSMAEAADNMEYELAALYRDRLQALAHVQTHQGINVSNINEADVIALEQSADMICIQVFFFRSGQNWGNHAFFPAQIKDRRVSEILNAFIGQFYVNKQPPKHIFVNLDPTEQTLLQEALSSKAGRQIRISKPRRGIKKELVARAATNAKDALLRRLAESASHRKLLSKVATLFNLDQEIQRIEVYDNSHIMGAHSVGAMVVVGRDGLQKKAYRKFNIKDTKLSPGDDYGMLKEVLTRRFNRLMKGSAYNIESSGEIKPEERNDSNKWPDIVLIDGGAGHLTAAQEILVDLGVNSLTIGCISKGANRNAGLETIHIPNRPPIELEPRSPVLFFIQRIRDEAHRFAINTHRSKRHKELRKSLLSQITGVGPKRRRALMNRFGSLSGIKQAAVADLAKVEGISRTVAMRIYEFFQPDE